MTTSFTADSVDIIAGASGIAAQPVPAQFHSRNASSMKPGSLILWKAALGNVEILV